MGLLCMGQTYAASTATLQGDATMLTYLAQRRQGYNATESLQLIAHDQSIKAAAEAQDAARFDAAMVRFSNHSWPSSIARYSAFASTLPIGIRILQATRVLNNPPQSTQGFIVRAAIFSLCKGLGMAINSRANDYTAFRPMINQYLITASPIAHRAYEAAGD